MAAAWLTRLNEAASPAALPPGVPAPQLDIAAALAAARLSVLGELTDDE